MAIYPILIRSLWLFGALLAIGLIISGPDSRAAEGVGAFVETPAAELKKGPVEHEQEEPMIAQPAQKSPDPDSTGPDQAEFPGVVKRLVKVDEPDKPTIYFYYPSIGNEVVDAAQQRFAENYIRAFIQETEGKEITNGDLSATYAISRPNDDILSVIYSIYSFDGGAHGNLIVYCFNHDLKTGELLKLEDIFSDPGKAVEIMSQISAQKLLKDLGEDADEDMIWEGTAPERENFSNIALRPDSILVEFQPYQVGPWSIGQQEVPISLEQLKEAGPAPRIWPFLGSGEK